jgi:hypothetical protein
LTSLLEEIQSGRVLSSFFPLESLVTNDSFVPSTNS